MNKDELRSQEEKEEVNESAKAANPSSKGVSRWVRGKHSNGRRASPQSEIERLKKRRNKKEALKRRVATKRSRQRRAARQRGKGR